MPSTIIGVLTREPEIRYTQDGLAKTTMYVHEYDSGLVHQILCEGILAENVALSVTKGTEVILSVEEPPVVYHANTVGLMLNNATAASSRIHGWEKEAI